MIFLKIFVHSNPIFEILSLGMTYTDVSLSKSFKTFRELKYLSKAMESMKIPKSILFVLT